MRTTVDIEEDLLRAIRDLAHGEETTLRQVVNRAIRLGLKYWRRTASRTKRYRCPTFDMGTSRYDLDRALGLAGELEDEEIARKMDLRK